MSQIHLFIDFFYLALYPKEYYNRSVDELTKNKNNVLYGSY